MLQETDPVRQVHLFVQDISAILERVAPIFTIMRAAAKTEPDIDGPLNNLFQQRLHNLTIFVTSLSAHTSLRLGLSTERATETVWALTSPDLFSLMIVDHGWSLEQYRDWLADALVRLLLL